MRIENVTPVSSIKKKSAKNTSAGGTFSLSGAEETTPAEGAHLQATQSISSIDSLLALQQAPAQENLGETLQRTDDLIRLLDQLRMDLLSDDIPTAHIQQLAAGLNQQQAPIADPYLHEIVSDVRLRAQIELAKRGL